MPGFEWFGEEERKEVHDVLETGVLFRYGFDQARKGCWKAKRLEADLAERLKAGYAHLCSSGTAALNIALASCGIGAGDEVVVPPFTFIATIESVLSVGAIPVFGEIDETLCLDPDRLEDVVTSRTRAILPVHMCGSMARIDEIAQFCSRKGLVLIEDACQALGGAYQGKSLGTFGQMGCFSFDPVKTITCGEGGAVITDDAVLYEKAHSYADHGHDHIGPDRGLEGHPILGTNHRISELNAAVGLAQLRKLDRMMEVQRASKAAIKSALTAIPELSFRTVPDENGDSATFLSFLLPSEDRARQAVLNLGRAGVDGCFYWYDNNWHYLRRWEHLKKMASASKLPQTLAGHGLDYERVHLPQSDNIIKRLISMQIKLSWTEADLILRIDKMRKVLGG